LASPQVIRLHAEQLNTQANLATIVAAEKLTALSPTIIERYLHITSAIRLLSGDRRASYAIRHK